MPASPPSLVSLPADVHHYITRYLERSDTVILRLVCKRFAQMFPDATGSQLTKQAVDNAARRGHLPLLQWLICTYRSKFDVVTFAGAAGGAHLKVMEWLEAHGCPYNWTASTKAAREGHVKVLEWLHVRGFKFYTGEMYETVLGGQLAALKWIWPHYGTNGYGWDDDCAYAAARLGHVSILEWLHEQRYPWKETDCAEHAAANGHVDVLLWLNEHGRMWSKLCARRAAENGHVDLLRYMVENGCEWEEPREFSKDASPNDIAAVKAYLATLKRT